jgi:hypothetical protein
MAFPSILAGRLSVNLDPGIAIIADRQGRIKGCKPIEAAAGAEQSARVFLPPPRQGEDRYRDKLYHDGE